MRPETPVPVASRQGILHSHETPRWDRRNLSVRCKVRVRPVSEVAGQVFVAEVECVPTESQRCQVAAPADLCRCATIKKLPGPDVVSGKDQFLFGGIPNGERPISDKFAKAIETPPIKTSSNDGNIRMFIPERMRKLRDQFVSIVEPPIPDHDLPVAGEVRLSFDA